MVWKKIVQVTGVSACPRCGNGAFDFEPGECMDDPDAKVKCGQCGYVCSGSEFIRRVDPDQQPKLPKPA
jgi:ribosomal protein S27AE